MGNSRTAIQVINDHISEAISYQEYRELVQHLAQAHQTTGTLQTADLAQYTQLNDRRMRRWDKTLQFSEEAITRITSVKQKITWLVLTESWCGDASPALPVLHKVAEINPNISVVILLRDAHLELMNLFLTNGAMSIPKLIAMDESQRKILFTWGPRSSKATALVAAHKQEHGELTPAFKEDLQVWYNRDKGQSILEDLLRLLPLE
ncbi:MAG: thioredoxin family protein [Maribacter sp.]